MPEMPDIFGELAAKFHHDYTQPQETRMTRIADAKAATDRASQLLASLAGNALAEAIADEGAGLSFGPPEITVVLNVIRAIEHGPGGQLAASEQQRPAQQAMTPGVSFSAAPAPATQVQPQQQA